MPPKAAKHNDKIDQHTFLQLKDDLDLNQDGKVSKDEYFIPYKKLFPKVTKAEFDEVWAKIDVDKNGDLSVDELAAHYGFNLSPDTMAKGAGGADMSDEQIMEALQMQAALCELQEEQAAKKKAAETAKKEADRGPNRRASVGRLNSREQAAEVTSIKIPTKITLNSVSPEIQLLQSCDLGDFVDMKKAVDSGANIMVEDEKGEMVCHKIARQGGGGDADKKACEAFRLILDHVTKGQGANAAKTMLNWQDKAGKTPLHFAAEYGRREMIALLLSRGTDYTLETSAGHSVLHAAVNSGEHQVVIDLLSNNAIDKAKIIDKVDKGKRTALHLAGFANDESGVMCKTLLDFGADKSIADVSGFTAGNLASKAGRRKSKELLEMP